MRGRYLLAPIDADFSPYRQASVKPCVKRPFMPLSARSAVA
jgi:hypothetical protein